MKRMIRLPVVVGLMLALVAVYAPAQDEAPKPSVTVRGTCVYLGTPRQHRRLAGQSRRTGRRRTRA